MPASGGCNPAQFSRRESRDPLIRGYLDKETRVAGSDWCVGAAEMPLKGGRGRPPPPESAMQNATHIHTHRAGLVA